MLVVDQAVLFETKLFARSCRKADFCAAWGTFETDGQFFKEYSDIVANRGKVGSLVLVARLHPKPLCQIALSFNGIRRGVCVFANAHEEVGISPWALVISLMPTKCASVISSWSLVAREKYTKEVVGFLHKENVEKELLIAHLKVHNDHQRKGVGRLLIQAAETQALSVGWAFESVSVRVLHVNSRAQQIFYRLGFDLHDEPAPEPTQSMLAMCAKMIRRAQHIPAPPKERTKVARYVQMTFARWHYKNLRLDLERQIFNCPMPEPKKKEGDPSRDDDSATHPSMPELIPVYQYWLDSPPADEDPFAQIQGVHF
ncbi:unnamed protein product, partial [Symbiodinium sp. CCMP2456]